MIASYYQNLFKELAALPQNERRFVYYFPTDHTGWGNKLRGFTVALLFAIATKRILVIREFLLEENFLPPEGCTWGHRFWRDELKALAAQTTTLILELSPSNWNEDQWQSYARESMDSLFPARVIALREGAGFCDQLIANPHYAALWNSVGLDTGSKLSWVGGLCKAFLNRPTAKLSRRYEQLKKRIGLAENSRFGVVQFRTFYDIGSPRKSMVNDFLTEVRRTLTEGQWLGVPVLVATDDAQVTRLLVAGLRPKTPAIGSRTRIIHTGYVHTGPVRFVERVLRKAVGKEIWIVDFWGWLPARFRPRPHTDVLAEWMLFGDAAFAISSFTSFAAYAMARTGNRAKLYRFNADTKEILPLKDEHYFF